MKPSSSIYWIFFHASLLHTTVSFTVPVPCRAAKRHTVLTSAGHFHKNSHLQSTMLDQIEEAAVSVANSASNATDEIGMKVMSSIEASFPDNEKDFSVQEREEKSIDWKEIAVLGVWMSGLTAFLLINNFVGPWPANLITNTPVEYFGLAHALGGMLFAGGIVLTTLIEWLVVSSKNPGVLKFWFEKVPKLDSFVVLPALTTSIVSGVGLSVDHYDSLGDAPTHVVAAISTLLAFAGWWAITDLTTQGAADTAVQEWQGTEVGIDGTSEDDVPSIVKLRRGSNVVSCLFVVALYAIMVLKPGYSP